MRRYNPKEIEPKWQKYWDEHATYTAYLDSDKPKYIAMSMFNYPSGLGIHIGHAMNYTISDVLARFKRQQGYESYHPIGWDSFGLPAENYAIKAGVSPQDSMATIIPNYHKQYKAMGWSNDWSKEIATHTPEYYKWSQWIFSELYRGGLAYQDARMQWWCEKCQTVLANEQVIDDKCWRHDSPDDPEVKKKEVKQWFFKITDYADELLEATDELDWTDSVKLAQKNWIGKSVGAEISFTVEGSDAQLTVFTTRPDTLFGATFMVVAPEHDIVGKITSEKQKQSIEAYVREAAKKTEVERQASKEKSGVFTGAYAINPANNEKIPIWIADYVLLGYGTGAIMAVPAHDERDYEFAQKFDLPVTEVIEPIFGEAQGDELMKPSIVGVVHNKKDDTFLVLDWGPRSADNRWGGNLFIGGGIEESEDLLETAKREITEETGYTNLKFIKKTTVEAHSYFYSNVKNKNIYAPCTGILFELEDDKQVETNLDTDEQDKFKIKWVSRTEITKVINPGVHHYMYQRLIDDEVYSGEGLITNSGMYDGTLSSDAREKIVSDLEKNNLAKSVTNYRMRDWSVSRQRYWGAPIPIINCDSCGPQLVPDEDLPVVLPELDDFAPSGDGRSALARATDWLKADCPKCGGVAERETDTLDTYIDSSWYMLRYFDSDNQKEAFSSKRAQKWMPIDFYNGADHATAHMLYARFITRFFYKQGRIHNPEPFKKFIFNGKVTAADGQMFSKSKGNGVDPLEIINQGYGADALRTYLMFAAPLELWTRWDPQGVPGTHRFLSRLWTLVQEFIEAQDDSVDFEETEKKLHIAMNRMTYKVTKDVEEARYNTAIAALMSYVNELYKLKVHNFSSSDVWKQALEYVVMCVAPFAPFIAEELWHQLGHEDSVHIDNWPQWDEKYLISDTVNIVVQINGKVRATIEASADAQESDVTAIAKNNDKIKEYLGHKDIKKTIFVKNRLLNFVV